jgi:hypothetical protein
MMSKGAEALTATEPDLSLPHKEQRAARCDTSRRVFQETLRRKESVVLLLSKVTGTLADNQVRCMPHRICPRCQHTPGRVLQMTTSNIAEVDYWRCPVCGHVWTLSRDRDEITTDVTRWGDEVPGAA